MGKKTLLVLLIIIIAIIILLLLLFTPCKSSEHHERHRLEHPAPRKEFHAQQHKNDQGYSATALLSDSGQMMTFNVQIGGLLSPIASAHIVANDKKLHDITTDFIGDGHHESSIANGLVYPLDEEEMKLLQSGKMQIWIETHSGKQIVKIQLK
jgi:hypothetical protein